MTKGKRINFVISEKQRVVATFSRDVMDFPFFGARAKVNGIDMYQETGFAKDPEDVQ